MFFVTEKTVNGRIVRYLNITVGEDDFVVGYIDNFDKVHFYTSIK